MLGQLPISDNRNPPIPLSHVNLVVDVKLAGAFEEGRHLLEIYLLLDCHAVGLHDKEVSLFGAEDEHLHGFVFAEVLVDLSEAGDKVLVLDEHGVVLPNVFKLLGNALKGQKLRGYRRYADSSFSHCEESVSQRT